MAVLLDHLEHRQPAVGIRGRSGDTGKPARLQLPFQQVCECDQRLQLLLALCRHALPQPAVDGLTPYPEELREIRLRQLERVHQT
jgi:hypothetical protein